MRDKDPESDSILDALFVPTSFLSLEHAQREMERRVREYNDRPQAVLGGLSPTHLSHLLNGDWETRGPVRLNESLTLEELSHVPIMADARTLLDYVSENEPLQETSTRSLRRANVAALRPMLLMPANKLVSQNRFITNSVNEEGVPWLADLRHVLLFGRLLVRRKGIRISLRGLELLLEERAGELYAHLFRTLFRAFSLGALGHEAEAEELQSTFAFTLYRLQLDAREWATPQALVESAWLESLPAPGDASPDAGRDGLRYITMKLCVLDPLFEFGLLDIRPAQRAKASFRDVEYRCTPLFARFISIDFARG